MKCENFLNGKWSVKDIIDSLGLFIIGSISLGYFLFYRIFAKLRLELSFLNFPIFIGEIALFTCGILLLIKFFLSHVKFQKWYYFLLVYLLFVFGKAMWGYHIWGPLAFRHAAEFYYPLFAIFGYSFYRKDFINDKTILFLTAVLIAAFGIRLCNVYALIPAVIIAVVLIQKHSNKKIKYALFILLLLSFPHSALFLSSRTELVSSSMVLIYLVISFFLTFKAKKNYKFMVFIVLLFFAGVGIIKFSNNSDRIRSLIGFKQLWELYNYHSKIIEDRSANFKMQELKQVRLFNAEVNIKELNNPALYEMIKRADKKFSRTKESQPLVKVMSPKIEEAVSSVEKMQFAVSQAKIELDAMQVKVKAVGSGSVRVQPEEKAILSEIEEAKSHIEKMQPLLKKVELDMTGAPLSTTGLLSSKKSGVKSQVNSTDFHEKDMPSKMEMIESEVERMPVNSTDFHEKDMPSKMEMIESEVERMQLHAEKVKLHLEQFQAKFDELPRSLVNEQGNIIFRLLIWKDMLEELKYKKPILGFDFGKPMRSKNIEILGWAGGEWGRDGWITAHNSYLDVVYRAGVVGVIFVISIFIVLFTMIKKFLWYKSITGILLCGGLINWLTAANLLLILELPYHAIPFWSLFGISFAYFQSIKLSAIK